MFNLSEALNKEIANQANTQHRNKPTHQRVI